MGDNIVKLKTKSNRKIAPFSKWLIKKEAREKG
jgi:hypothetical protein